MIIWIILFVVVFFVSFVLTYRSMGDFKEKPSNLASDYSLYLIKNRDSFNEAILHQLHQYNREKKRVFSIERLFKGNQSALVLYISREVIGKIANAVDILELEDYSFKSAEAKVAISWEIGLKNSHQSFPGLSHPLTPPRLNPDQEFWWQILLEPLDTDSSLFHVEIRAVLLGSDNNQIKEILPDALRIGSEDGLGVLPSVYSPSQLMSFYNERSFTPAVLAKTLNKGASFKCSGHHLVSLITFGN